MTSLPWSAQDVFRIESIEEPAWSPDGRSLVYVRATPDESRNTTKRVLWMRTDRGAHKRFSAGTAVDRAPRWSPDGTQIAFLSTRGGDGMQLYLIDRDGGEAALLASIPTGISDFVWSPDGTQIACISALAPADIAAEAAPKAVTKTAFEREQAAARAVQAGKDRIDPRVITELPFRTGTDYIDGKRAHLYLVDVAVGSASIRRVTVDDRDYRSPSWSADGRSIYATCKTNPATTDYFVGSALAHIDLTPEKPTVRIMADAVWSVADAHVSPDGRWVAAIAQKTSTPFYGAAVLLVRATASEASWRVLETQDHTIGAWEWLPDSSGIAYVAEWHGRGWLSTAPIRPGATMHIHAPVIGAGEVIDAFAVRADGVVAIVSGGPTSPCEFWLTTASGTERISPWPADWHADRITVPFQELWYVAPDGQQVQGWLLAPATPPSDAKAGLVVHIHGGPHAMWSPGTRSMWLEWQATAGSGFYVFFCNPRGSEGYGAAFQAATRANWGHADQPDFEAGIDAVIATGAAIDTARIGVTGGSYGGFMTTWLIGHSKRFAAAVAVRGVYNLLTQHSMSDAYELIEYSYDLVPWRDAHRLWDMSPIASVAEMTAPLLIIHSEQDYRVPIGEAEQLYTQLKRLGRTVEFVRYPREGHELTRSGEPIHKIDHMQRTIDWFVRFLGA